MNSILLSIHPKYVENILCGAKKFEYRKRLVSNNIEYIYIYSTSPVMKVVARVKVTDVLQASPTALWEKTKTAFGISLQAYSEYFEGCKSTYAYELGDIQVYETPKYLHNFGVNTAPQSFVYIDGDTM